MQPIAISSKFQIVIPRALRERMQLKAGQKLQAMEIDGIIHLIPIVPLAEAQGLLGPPFDSTIEREPDRDLDSH